MKKLIIKYASVISAFAMMIAVGIANSACAFFYGQPPTPASLKKLRKF